MMTKKTLIYLIILLTSLVGFQCTSTRHSKAQKQTFKSIYIKQFKLVYFWQLLNKSYNNSKAVQEIIGGDHSGFTEAILTADDFKLIDSLTIADNEKLKIDSMQGDQRAEGAQGKRPLGFILDRLGSKWLDSIANKRYKHSGIKRMYGD